MINEPKITMILGSRGRGKTGTLIRHIVPGYIARRQPEFGFNKIAIIDLEDNYNYNSLECLSDASYPESHKKVLRRYFHAPVKAISRKRLPALKSGAVRVLPGDEFAGEYIDGVIDDICYNKAVKQCLIVFEDAARFMPANNGLDSVVRDMIINAKQRAMDIVFIFHFWSDVPPKLCKWIDTLYLHHCDESVAGRKKAIGESKYARILEAENRIKKNSNKYYFEKINLN